jgi:hypothetical protein
MTRHKPRKTEQNKPPKKQPKRSRAFTLKPGDTLDILVVPPADGTPEAADVRIKFPPHVKIRILKRA